MCASKCPWSLSSKSDSGHTGENRSIKSISDNFRDTDFTAVPTVKSFSNFILVNCSKPGLVEGVRDIEMNPD